MLRAEPLAVCERFCPARRPGCGGRCTAAPERRGSGRHPPLERRSPGGTTEPSGRRACSCRSGPPPHQHADHAPVFPEGTSLGVGWGGKACTRYVRAQFPGPPGRQPLPSEGIRRRTTTTAAASRARPGLRPARSAGFSEKQGRFAPLVFRASHPPAFALCAPPRAGFWSLGRRFLLQPAPLCRNSSQVV